MPRGLRAKLPLQQAMLGTNLPFGSFNNAHHLDSDPCPSTLLFHLTSFNLFAWMACVAQL
jgi:hypothetical protein